MHLTLHFLGDGDVGRLAPPLQQLQVSEFRLTVQGVGQFPSAGGAVTLWAGVRQSAELAALHAAVAAALRDQGFRPGTRRYTPHVTLARCEPRVAAEVVDGFLARHAAFSLADVPVAALGLYCSTFVDEAPVYRREQVFPLQVPGIV
jgi:RNA 2',3'-cyclic 3'-phosphodiesterase